MASLRERTRLSRALNDIDARIHANLGSDEILQSALDGFVHTLSADAGDIKILEGEQWVIRYQQGLGPEEIGIRLDAPQAPIASQAAQLREPVVISDFHNERTLPYAGYSRAHSFRGVIAVPLIVRGDVAGCLYGWIRDHPRTFSAGELDFARRIAASVALALENAWLYDAEKKARERAETAEQRLKQELETTRVLLKASDEITSTTDCDEILERLSHVVLEATGISRAFINLIDMKQEVLIPKIATGGLITPEGDNIPFHKLTETSRAAIHGRKTTLLDYERPDIPPYDCKIAESNGARLVLFVPLVHSDTVVGHISLDEIGQRYEFSSEQIRIVESIAAQAAVAIQNARQYEREHRIAEVLQQALLAPPEQIETVEIAHLYQAASAAARVGGDFYDVFELADGRVALMVGDVAGKGLQAAQLTALLRDGARAYLLEDHDPASCLTRLNTLAWRFTPLDKFATVFLGVLNHETGELHYCSAAHPNPMVMADTGVRALKPEPATLLGAFPGVRFTSSSTVISPGEVLVVVTDGVTEARRGAEMFGDDGLAAALERLQGTAFAELPEALLGEVVAFAGERLRDDVVVLCASRHG